jgi:phage tail protein X
VAESTFTIAPAGSGPSIVGAAVAPSPLAQALAPAMVEYVTREGDRWDLIAWRMYGDPWAFEVILAANPQIPIRPVLRGGVHLVVPVRAQAVVDETNLPPWKRTS